MAIFIVLIVVCILIFIAWKTYSLKFDTIIAFTGGLGSGKSLESVNLAIKLLKRQRLSVKLHNFRYKDNQLERPMLYSSIPIRISKKEWSLELTEGHLLLTERIIPRSIVFIDEIGSYANQFQFKNPNILDNFNEFIRLFRHYTLGGFLVVNDQCSENIVLEVRRRINKVFNLMNFRKWFKFFYTVQIRNINISEEIKTIEDDQLEDSYKLKFGIILPFKRYDTYCYSERYNTVPNIDTDYYSDMKKYNLLKVSERKIDKLTTDVPPDFIPQTTEEDGEE